MRALKVIKSPIRRLSFKGTSTHAKNGALFGEGLSKILQSLIQPKLGKETLFCSDNLIAWNRNLSFLRDPYFIELLRREDISKKEKGIVWRTYLLEFLAQFAATLDGDFLEVGCYSGHTASVLADRIDFATLGKRYVLYDLFAWNQGDKHYPLGLREAGDLYETVRARFADNPAVTVVKGRVPDSFAATLPDRIAFAHIDMNNADAEAAAIEAIYPRLPHAGILVLDDYGWWTLSDQKVAVDAVLARFGEAVAELPKGQGIVIKKAAP